MPYRLRSLKDCGSKTHSQNDEDGIIEAIFADIPPQSKYFVEFGIGPNWQDPTYSSGMEGNCVLLRKNGWRGLFMDGGTHPPDYNIQKEFITAININSLLRKVQHTGEPRCSVDRRRRTGFLDLDGLLLSPDPLHSRV